MTPKAQKLNQLIAKLPVCAAGQNGIRDLVAEITGENLKPEEVYKIGQHFTFERPGGPVKYILSMVSRGIGESKVLATNLTSGGSRTGTPIIVKDHLAITEEELLRVFGIHASKRSRIKLVA